MTSKFFWRGMVIIYAIGILWYLYGWNAISHMNYMLTISFGKITVILYSMILILYSFYSLLNIRKTVFKLVAFFSVIFSIFLLWINVSVLSNFYGPLYKIQEWSSKKGFSKAILYGRAEALSEDDTLLIIENKNKFPKVLFVNDSFDKIELKWLDNENLAVDFLVNGKVISTKQFNINDPTKFFPKDFL